MCRLYCTLLFVLISKIGDFGVFNLVHFFVMDTLIAQNDFSVIFNDNLARQDLIGY